MIHCLKELKNISKIQIFDNFIDPLYPTNNNVQSDFFELPKTRGFNFARPHRTTIQKYDSYSESWENITIDTHESYYVPNDIYDFYYSPNELNSLDINERIQLIYEFFFTFSHLYLNNQSESYKKWTDYYINGYNMLESIQMFITDTGYHVVDLIPYPEKFLIKQYSLWSNSDIIFNETWNTIKYYHLFIPRKKTFFVNIRNLTCSCNNFKNKHCYHTFYHSFRRVLYSKIENMPIVLDICHHYFFNK